MIVAATLLWIWPGAGKASQALTVIFKGGALIWAADEIVRGLNPWQRCLGAVVALYELSALL